MNRALSYNIGRSDLDRKPVLRLILDFEVQHLNVITINVARFAGKGQKGGETIILFLQLRSGVAWTDVLGIHRVGILNVG
jgi:hypothetical protein